MEYELVSTSRIGGFTVRNYVPKLTEEERKAIATEIVTNLLREYNRLELERIKTTA